MRLFAIAIALLTAMPAIGDEPVQVQLDVMLLTGPASMLEKPEIKSLLPKNFNLAGAISTCVAQNLIEIARQKYGAKLLAQPKLVTLSGRKVCFQTNGQQVELQGAIRVLGREARSGDITTQLTLLPVVQESGPLRLKSNLRVRATDPQNVVKTPFGSVPAFDERNITSESKLAASRSVLLVDRRTWGEQLVIVTPRVLAGQPIPTHATADHAKHVAAMLVREYQQACKMKNAELATKLAHMAVELDPMCFKIAPSQVEVTANPVLLHYKPTVPEDINHHPITSSATPVKSSNYSFWDLLPSLEDILPYECWPDSIYLNHRPMYLRPDPDFPLERELAAQQDYYHLATGARRSEQQPTDKEVLAAMKTNSIKSLSSDEVEIVCEKIVDRVDPSRVFPLLGQAQLHHCQWKCTVYYNDSIGIKWPLKIGMKTQRKAVIYIDKDCLEHKARRD